MSEPISVIGGGAVGLNLAARLARAGADVLLVVRRRAVAAAIESDGACVSDPASGARWRVALPVTTALHAIAPRLRAGPAILCTRAGDEAGLAKTLAEVEPRARVVTAQNGVGSESAVARHVAHVSGLVVRQTCTRDAEDVVLATGSGRIVLGRHPRGIDETTAALAGAFARAGFDVSESEQIAADKWLKLCVNTLSPVNALVRRADHTHPAFVDLKIRLLEEARDVLDAAGVRARPCDGRDRDLTSEIARLEASRGDGSSVRDLPLYNAVWAALRDPRKPLEADEHHRRILELAEATGRPAAAHEGLRRSVLEAYRDACGPEIFGARALFDQCLSTPDAT